MFVTFVPSADPSAPPVLLYCTKEGDATSILDANHLRDLIEKGIGVRGMHFIHGKTVIEVQFDAAVIEEEDVQEVLDSIPPGYGSTVRKLLVKGFHGSNAEHVIRHVVQKAADLSKTRRISEEIAAKDITLPKMPVNRRDWSSSVKA